MTEGGVLQTSGTGQAECEERAVTTSQDVEVPFTQEWQVAGKG